MDPQQCLRAVCKDKLEGRDTEILAARERNLKGNPDAGKQERIRSSAIHAIMARAEALRARKHVAKPLTGWGAAARLVLSLQECAKTRT